MNDRECKRCGASVLQGYLEGVVEITLSRTPITRASALTALTEGLGVAACQRARLDGEIRSQFWHELLGPQWTPLLEHDCETWP